MSFLPAYIISKFAETNYLSMKIGTDKWKHFGVNYAICAVGGSYGVALAVGASLGKEYGDKMAPGNKWDWMDILADICGIAAGYLTHIFITWVLKHSIL